MMSQDPKDCAVVVELMMLVSQDPKGSVELVAVRSLESRDPKHSREQVFCLVLVQLVALAWRGCLA